MRWNRNCGCRKVASLTLPSFARLPCDVMAGFTRPIKFLGNKLFYGHVPDPYPFPLRGIGSGHARLLSNMASKFVMLGWGMYGCSGLQAGNQSLKQKASPIMVTKVAEKGDGAIWTWEWTWMWTECKREPGTWFRNVNWREHATVLVRVQFIIENHEHKCVIRWPLSASVMSQVDTRKNNYSA